MSRRGSKDQPKYLYLARPEYAQTWVHGGTVPLMPARTYRSVERHRTQTPDEVMQKSIRGMKMAQLKGAVEFSAEGTIEGFVMERCVVNGHRIDRGTYAQRPEEAVILCMSNSLNPGLLARLGKSVAVKIPAVGALQECLDPQVGVPSLRGKVSYTREEGNRHHFLKSLEDQWQDEYRLVWTGPGLGLEPIEVAISAGLAEMV